jgi:hypothetical protein
MQKWENRRTKINSQIASRCKSYPISNYIKCTWIKISIKRQRRAECTKQTKAMIQLYSIYIETIGLKVKTWKVIYHVNSIKNRNE